MAKPIKIKTNPNGSEISLPENVRVALEADFGSEINLQLAEDFALSVGQLAKMTKLVRDVFYKKVKVLDLSREISLRLGLAKEKAEKLAVDICGRRLMIVNKGWFGDEPAALIKAFGRDVKDFKGIVDKFIEQVATEQVSTELQRKREKEEELKEAAKIVKARAEEEKSRVAANPEEEKKSAKTVFSTRIVELLRLKDAATKIELNVRTITLLLLDQASKQFQKDLLDALYNNKELISQKPIELKADKVEPSISNWLKDYIDYVGLEEAVSSVKRAQYFTNSKNVKELAPSEKEILSDLFNLYIAVKNFYDNTSRYDLEDIRIFAISEVELDELLKKIEKEIPPETQSPAETAKPVEKPINIMELYRDKPADRQRTDGEKQRIIQATRKEADKVADILEDSLLTRKKYHIFACLEVLAESGALDNVLAEDSRYQAFLSGYFKRNNLSAEDMAFKKNPYQAKYMQYFLKFVFLERLGMAEPEGARLAANLAKVFQSKGDDDYAKLAYLDLTDNKFKWTEL